MTEEAGPVLRGGIQPLLFPRSVAVVGASERNLRPIENAALGGQVALVNPNRAEVAGRPCHPSIASLAEAAETALVLVSHGRVVDAVREAIAAGARSFVIPGVGAEAGAEGPAVAAELRALLEEAGAAAIGANCMGVAVPSAPSTWIGTVPATFLPGHVSVVAQSGSIGEAFLACGPRVGFRAVVSSGSELSRDVADLVGFLAGDEGTQAIGLFLETVRRPRSLAAALAAAAEAGKPVVCLKVGRSDAAARATMAHTGSLVGSARAFSALLRAYGVIEVDDFHDLLETLEVLGAPRRPSGRRVAAVSESGGECALLADQGEACGLPFEPLPPSIESTLRAEFPNFVAPANPVDAWAIADENVVYPRTLELLAGSGAYDLLLAQVDVSQYRGESEGVWMTMILEALGDAVRGTGVFPAMTSVHSSDPPAAIARLARERGIPLLRGSAHAMRALAAVSAWAPRTPPPAPAPAGEPITGSGALPELESAALLQRYGVPFAPHQRCDGADEAAAAAERLGFPVVVKVDGPAHKSRSGGVVLGLGDADAVRRAADELGGRVLVARQVAAGPEAICGMVRDPDLGPVLAVGPGGAAVEELSLAVVQLAPVDLDGAMSLVMDAPGLAGIASEEAREDLARTLVALGQLALEHPEVSEIDVNPLVLGADGAVAVDALVVVGR